MPEQPARRSVLAGLLLAGTGLAGCARIPTSGPVSTQTDVGAGPVGRPFPNPPGSGSTPEQIVAGFLRAAGLGASDDFEVARTYLVPEQNVEWDSDAQVVVYTEPEIVVLSGPGSTADRTPSAGSTAGPSATTTSAADRPRIGVTAEIDVRLRGVLASVDRQGRLTAATPGEEQRRRFSLVVARDGEWRIARLDPGLVATQSQWRGLGLYRPTPLYYPDPTGRWLVPDVRYLRQGSKSTPALVVTALLKGPSAWLRPAVTEPQRWPALEVSSVPVENQVATVDLDRTTLALEESVQATLRVQLRDSLREVTASALVRDVRMTVDGQPLQDVSGSPSGPDPAPGAGRAAEPQPAFGAGTGATFVGVDAKARVVVGDARVVRVVEGLALAGGARPAMSYTESSRTYALVVTGKDAGVRTLKVAEGTADPLDVVSAPDLVTPSFDSNGWVWTSTRRAAGRFTAGILVGGKVRLLDVAAPWLSDGQVVAVRVSREGARALVAVDTVGADGRRRTRIRLAGVVRSREGEPVRLTSPVPLLPDVVRASDVAWLDDRRVVVLGSRRRDDKRLVVQPWVVDVGGDPTEQGVEETADLGQIVVGADGKPLTTPDAWERLPLDVAPTLAVGVGLEALFVAGPRGDLFQYRTTGTWERRVTVFRPAFPG